MNVNNLKQAKPIAPLKQHLGTQIIKSNLQGNLIPCKLMSALFMRIEAYFHHETLQK